MNTVRRWLPIALCCLPGIALVGVVVFGFALGRATFGAWLGGPLGLGLIALAMLACPLSMVLMMRSGTKPNAASGESAMMADCCAPDESAAESESGRLTALRSQREALEREIAALQTRQPNAN